jgi:membrane protein DedA with SNARE-associated domain
MIPNIVDWMTNIMGSLGYLGVTIAVFLETVFPPIPSGFIQPFSGFVASRSDQTLILTIVAATVGSYLGTVPFYFLGLWGEDFVNKFLYKYGKYLFIDTDEVDKAYEFFDKHGHIIVLTGRLIPFVRTVISFPAGVAKMPFKKFTLYTVLGGAIWSTILATGGFLLGERWEIIMVWLEQYETLSILLMILLVVVYFVYEIVSKKIVRKI